MAWLAIPVRICAKRKEPDAVEKTQKKLKRLGSKKQFTVSDMSKIFNEYIVVITNISADISATEILEAYRYRWQVEIYFKRLKSILDFGEMPKRRQDSVTAWLNGKLMIALLIEIIIAKSSFPPKETVEQEYLA